MNDRPKLRVLDLFSGIGGFSLGLERTGGFETVAFCEIEAYPRQVLAKHWPGVPIYHDVRELTADTLSRDGIAVDVICGGFPCQDISTAGAGAGIEGARSGLWGEYARLIGELRPRYVIVENVAALLGRGLGRVLGDLAALGYNAQWDCIPASAVGAPHRRDRVWIVAHPASIGHGEGRGKSHVHQANGRPYGQLRTIIGGAGKQPENVANSDSARPQGRIGEVVRECASQWTARPSSPSVADSAGSGWRERDQDTGRRSARAGAPQERSGSSIDGWWLTEPDVGRVAHGVPARVDRLKGLGNAVVPQIPEMIGRAILEAAE